ncbi:MAG: family 65 glycosyl hydrolase domain-containing protein [Flavobacteriaceae bacterium]|nr:family 65 glycosyl hydrolase domain-containing protein [Flavobacteriaceae bacterium]
MNQNYIIEDPWNIIENGFEPNRVKASESLFSLGNGAMGQRANFEEHYSGESFQGSYIAGVYYPDKTRVGWWKNGYPEYFAKVLNAPNWIGIDIEIDGISLDLNACKVNNFKRVLNMQEGWYQRNFRAVLSNGLEIEVIVKRFLSLTIEELGAISYKITPINKDASIRATPYIDAGIQNEDSNWDDQFWEDIHIIQKEDQAFIRAKTAKSHFETCTFMQSLCFVNGTKASLTATTASNNTRIGLSYNKTIEKGQTFELQKYGGYTTDRKQDKAELVNKAQLVLKEALALGFAKLLEQQKMAWAKIWEMADIQIHGDIKAQQGIRFNIFHLNQTYLGTDSSLNIGPKGFTGEKYGGSTYWDTEAYCLPFYMATKNQEVARNLLQYRYLHLDKAIENAEKLGFNSGAALYPMVTMNGEECHNEWEITFEEIHRNGAIAFAIYNYERYTGDKTYMPEMGLEVLIGIARFWKQRASYSNQKKAFVILGVTGPNEYENNVNNNWYTNYIAKWCLHYANEQCTQIEKNDLDTFNRITKKTTLTKDERDQWQKVSDAMYLPFDEKLGVYMQQDGFLDKEMTPASKLDPKQRPINQYWSWDRILRSPYIKQADVLQGFYFFEDHFSKENLEKHFNYYEPFTVHESSLSPCVHSIQAANLGYMEMAYDFYLRTSRLDLDDYNKEVHEGLHITSMAGTWMSIVEGFGGLRIKNDTLTLQPQVPKQWDGFSFKINFRSHIITVHCEHDKILLTTANNGDIDIQISNQSLSLKPNTPLEITL